MKVKEAMSKTISTASPKDPLKKVAELMKKEDAGFMPITENGSVVGVVTDRDIVIRALADGHSDIAKEPAEHCMTRDVVTVEANADIDEAAGLMDRHEIRRLPVTENGRLVGVLSHGNLVQAARSQGPADTATLGVTRGA